MHSIRSWSAAAPITMSSIVLMLMATDALFGLNPLPIHDEGAIDHIAMILMFGQVPIILYFVFNGRREIKRILPVLATQLSLGAIIFAAVHYSDHASEALVARRIRDRLPIP